MAKDAYGEKKRQQNTLWLAGAAKHALDNNMDPTVVSTLFEEGKRRGILDPSADPSQASKQGMMKIYQGAVTSLGGDTALQSQVTDNRTAPMKNYEQRQKLVDQYGEQSAQVRTFDNYVRKIPGLTVLEVQRSDGSTQQILYDPASANQWDLSGRQIAQGPSNYTPPGQQIQPQQPSQQPPMQQPPMGAAPPTAGAVPPTAGAVPRLA